MEKKKKKLTATPMQRIRKQFEINRPPSLGEINNQPSCTIPDMTLTILELLKNHTRGEYSDVAHNEGIYSETEIPVFDDMTDRDNYIESLKTRKNDLEHDIKQELLEKKQKQLKLDKEAAERLKKHEKDNKVQPITSKPEK